MQWVVAEYRNSFFKPRYNKAVINQDKIAQGAKKVLSVNDKSTYNPYIKWQIEKLKHIKPESCQYCYS